MSPVCRVKVYSLYAPRTVAESAAVFQDFLTEVVYPFAKTSGIEKIWHFFEPYAEITWVDSEANGQKFRDFLVENAPRYNMSVEKLTFDQTGGLADWFCTNDIEREFGAEVHSLCARFYQAYQERKFSVDGGKGLHAQVGRTIHRLCNPLGINYKREAKLCFSRGLICALFCMFGFKKAIWIYTKIFRQKY